MNINKSQEELIDLISEGGVNFSEIFSYYALEERKSAKRDLLKVYDLGLIRFLSRSRNALLPLKDPNVREILRLTPKILSDTNHYVSNIELWLTDAGEKYCRENSIGHP